MLTIAGFEMTWVRGAMVFGFGSAMTFGSFAFASQSLLASLGTLQFISNVVFSRFVLLEPLSWRVVAATLLIVAGVVLTASFSNHSSDTYSVQDLLALYDSSYVFFLEMLGLTLLLQLSIYVIYTNREASRAPLPLSSAVRPITFASVAATIGSQSVLQSKCIAEIIRSSSLGDTQESQWFVAVITGVFLSGLVVWLLCLNEALKLFEGAVIIPLLQVCWTVSAIMQGGVYFREFRSFTPSQYAGFVCGLAVVVLGVAVLTVRTAAVGDTRTEESAADSLIAAEEGEGDNEEEEGDEEEGRRSEREDDKLPPPGAVLAP